MRVLALIEPAEVTYQAGKDGWWCRRDQGDEHIVVGKGTSTSATSGIITLHFQGFNDGSLVQAVAQRQDGVTLVTTGRIGADDTTSNPVETANALIDDLVHTYEW